MKILLIGSGAREHALAKAIKQTDNVHLYNIGSQKNPGIAAYVEIMEVMSFSEMEKIISFAQKQQIDWVIIGPEKPLELGLADRFWQAGIPVVGPTQALARIETSKAFARDLMKRYNIPGLPKYYCYSHYQKEVDACLQSFKGNYVIKADGLMSGKGVKVAGEHLHNKKDAIIFCEEIAGPFVIEEKLFGPEFSLLSFSDGTTLVPMPAVQDHKRLLVGDQGPNTGGMGTFTLANHRLPFLTEDDISQAQAINEAVVAALFQETGEYYRGILYGGFMKTAHGIKVIEFNARFGDPESINLLSLLNSNFVAICQAIIEGTLSQVPVQFKNQASVCKYIVPLGYPNKPDANGDLDVREVLNSDSLYYGCVEARNERLTMLGSRALAVISLASDLEKAEQEVENTIRAIKGEFHYRSDIGKENSLKIAVLGSTRGSYLKTLIEELQQQKLSVEVVLVLSDKEDAPILERAEELGITSLHVPALGLNRSDYAQALDTILIKHQINLVVLMGFMRILDSTFTQKWAKKTLNIHPSLLPKYAGLMDLEVHRAVIAAGEIESGCTVHFVEEQVDAGQIVVQKKCLLEPQDTPELLKAKVQKIEVLALTEAITLLSHSATSHCVSYKD